MGKEELYGSPDDMTLLDGQYIKQSSLVDCNPDYEMLAALHAVETVVYTQRHGLDTGRFPIFRLVTPARILSRLGSPCCFE